MEKPRGPHHCARWSGDVQSLKTRSRGASKRRVTESSRSAVLLVVVVVPSRIVGSPSERWWGDVAGLLVRVRLLVLGLDFLQVRVEAVKTLFPEPAVVVDPVGDVLQRGG